MDTILPSLVSNVANPGLSGAAAASGSGVAGSFSAEAAAEAAGPVSDRGDTVTFSAEALAKAAAMASNAGTTGNIGTASNAGAGLDAKGQTLGGAEQSGEKAKEGGTIVEALKARVERIQEEIKATEEGDLPQKERDTKLAELRLELVEAQTAYYKAKQQAGNDQGGSASQTAAGMAGLA